jgi:hypothetical protein
VVRHDKIPGRVRARLLPGGTSDKVTRTTQPKEVIITEAFKEGDAVEMEISDGEILVIGKVIAVEDPVGGVSDEDADLAVKWVEVHAFHRIWGGSNAQRGKEHVTPTSTLEPVRTGYRHIVEQYG